MSARASLAPGPRRGTGAPMQPMPLSSSQSSGPSSQSTFAFRPHVLLQTQERGRKPDGTPLLDYSDLAERIEVFKELFSAQSDHMMQGLKRSTDEHESQLRDEKRNVELTREAIDRQREEQKKLYQTIASERQADSSAHSQLSLLQSSRTSLAQRLIEGEEEKERLGTLLEQKMRERDSRKARLVSEIKRNRPELLRFNEKLGCRVSAGSEKTASGKSTIKFTFTLINPDDWSYEAKFVIDASKSQYKSESLQSGRQALSVTDTDLNGSPQPLPTIAPDKLDTMLAELNSSRALFTFIKRMRAAFKEAIERQRLAEKAARRAA